MRWLVDGMNVIGSRPDGWWKDRGQAMARLTAELEAWAAAHPDEHVAVVFDGRERDVGAHEHVDVAFAPGGRNAADHAIAARVQSDADAASLTVVTSDRELVERVRAAGAAVEGAKTFRARLYPDA